MRVAFFMQERGAEMAAHLIASVNRVMPGVEIFQLTNETCPEVPGAKAIRLGGDMPMGVRRITHYSLLEGEWVFCDTDVLFRKDVRHIFERDFDVALASRVGTYMDGSQYAKVMPYNFGVVFSRNPAYWQTILPALKKLAPDLQEWEGEQLLTCQLAKTDLFNVEILSCGFNFTPKEKTDDLTDVSVLHLKGPIRKTWLPDLAQT